MTAGPLSIVLLLDRAVSPRAAQAIEAVQAASELAQAAGAVTAIDLHIGDLSLEPLFDRPPRLKWIDDLELGRSDRARGSVAARADLAARAEGEIIVFLDPGLYPAPTLLVEFLAVFRDPQVGAADGRRLPLEHPKDYDNVTGETGYVSVAALAVRRSVFELVGGFDADTFPAVCADVDLSWRIRAAGFLTVHTPRAVVASNDRLGEQMPDSPFEAAAARLLLTTKWGRDDLAQSYLKHLDMFGSDEHRRAAQHFRALEAAGELPARVNDAERVAQFLGSTYAPHRWDAPWAGRT